VDTRRRNSLRRHSLLRLDHEQVDENNRRDHDEDDDDNHNNDRAGPKATTAIAIAPAEVTYAVVRERAARRLAALARAVAGIRKPLRDVLLHFDAVNEVFDGTIHLTRGKPSFNLIDACLEARHNRVETEQGENQHHP
jgi:hypothetical protein